MSICSRFSILQGFKVSIFPIGNWRHRYNNAALPRSLWYDILNFSMHNSTRTQNVLNVSSLWVLVHSLSYLNRRNNDDIKNCLDTSKFRTVCLITLNKHSHKLNILYGVRWVFFLLTFTVHLSACAEAVTRLINKLETPRCGYNFWFRRSKVKVTWLENLWALSCAVCCLLAGQACVVRHLSVLRSAFVGGLLCSASVDLWRQSSCPDNGEVAALQWVRTT